MLVDMLGLGVLRTSTLIVRPLEWQTLLFL